MRWLSRLFSRTRKSSPFTPRNHLERLLVKAAVDTAVRPDFMHAFVDSQIYVIGWVGDQPSHEEGEFVAEGGEKLSIQHTHYEGREVVPVFTSPDRVAEYAPGTTYVGMTTRSLFETIGVQEVLLNPASQYGKHFTLA